MKIILVENLLDDEKELGVFEWDSIPQIKTKFFFNDKLYKVFDILWHVKKTEYSKDFYEPYVEVIIVKI